MKTFIEIINETEHKIDKTGYISAPWQDKIITRNVDGMKGVIGKPTGDPNKSITGYVIHLDDGTQETLSLTAIKKQYEFYRKDI